MADRVPPVKIKPLDDSYVDVQEIGLVTVVSPRDKHLTGEGWTRLLRRVIGDQIDKSDSPLILLDLGKVEHMSSAILGELIGLNRKITLRGGKFRLAAMRPEVAEIFAITRLHQSFEIRPSVEAALTNFQP
ncbi:MAG: anti-sigma factor antagonist [Phycisphaeraceae bacterium]|nr:anti-sigma factor antagonist [Phycisphaeraceae bacterium]